MKKRVLTIILTVTLCLSFAGCSSSPDKAVSIGKASVSSGVYAYYLDYVMSHPDKLGLPQDLSEQQASDAAVGLCRSHIAVSSLCKQNGWELSNIEKSDTAEKVESFWGMFGNYYTSIGVTKQDYTLVSENAAKRDMLISSYFGENGKDPVTNAELIQAFNKKYVGFRAITGYLTSITDDGSAEVVYTDDELKKIYSDFETLTARINNGANIDVLNSEYNESQGLSGPDSLSVIIIDETDTTYAKGFFDEVSSIQPGEAVLIKTNDYIYVVQRANISSEEYLSQYENVIIEALRSDDIDALISDWTANHAQPKTSGKLAGIYKTVSAVHTNDSSAALTDAATVATTTTTAPPTTTTSPTTDEQSTQAADSTSTTAASDSTESAPASSAE